MAKLGAFTFVLHCHLPYCRLAGEWPHGEAWIHEAAAETYIPLLNALFDLHEHGTPVRLTLDLTPVLCEQLADADVKSHVVAYLDDRRARAERDVSRLQAAGEPHRAQLAEWYQDWYAAIKQSFVQRYRRDVVGAFRRLQDLGVVEIVTSAATHAYLPLLATDENITAQLRVAVKAYRRHFRRAPRGVWLPECAYRPGLETCLAQGPLGFRYFFADAHPLVRGNVVGRAAGDALTGSGCLRHNFAVPLNGVGPRSGSTFQPYFVGPAGSNTHSGVAVVARNERAVAQVWNSDWGYPSDKDYRDFHKWDAESGLKYWRVTDRSGCMGCKEEWVPQVALQRASEHARHYAQLVTGLLKANADAGGGYGVVCASFDAELFGHWWFEGVDWLRETLQLLADSDAVDLTTAGDYLDQHPPEDVLALPAGSWGQGSADADWEGEQTRALWQAVNQAEQRMTEVARQFHGRATVEMEPFLAQLARENLLLQSSDWPFLVISGQAADYALQRFNTHLGRFNQLADALEHGQFDVRLPSELYEQDKVFPEVDWRWWA